MYEFELTYYADSSRRIVYIPYLASAKLYLSLMHPIFFLASYILSANLLTLSVPPSAFIYMLFQVLMSLKVPSQLKLNKNA